MSINQIETGLSQKTKDKFNYGFAGFLIVAAVTLAFTSFVITLTIGHGVIAWSALALGTALTLIGGGMYFHNQLVTFETNANRKMAEMSAQVDRECRRMNRYPNRYSRDKGIEPEPEDYFQDKQVEEEDE